MTNFQETFEQITCKGCEVRLTYPPVRQARLTLLFCPVPRGPTVCAKPGYDVQSLCTVGVRQGARSVRCAVCQEITPTNNSSPGVNKIVVIQNPDSNADDHILFGEQVGAPAHRVFGCS